LNLLGIQILLDLEQCNVHVLDDIDYIKRLLIKSAVDSGATIVGESFHKFNPVGVTGIVSIAESHISIHTWPEHFYAAIDIFSCGKDFDIEKSKNILITGLEPKHSRILRLERGLEND
jgi:S-adenosylmethionine decarboxylase|tara:strand:+ start:970 stop:1323 length:354 start_codon:yes stop_codon:yes gene_type:complete